MNAQSILTQLSFNEFSNLSLSNDGDGTIRKSDLGKVLTLLNDGLLDLTSKFKIMEKVVHIELHEHITTYHLVPRFAESQQPQPDVSIPYILDKNRTPFKGDVNKVIAVWDSEGRQRKLNDENDKRSIFTMQKDSITVPFPEKDVVLFVHYQAAPLRITVNNLDEELDIPDSLVPALRAYIAYKMFISMGNNDSIRIGQEYQNQYILLINDLKGIDALSDSRFMHNTFEERGWV